MTGEPEVPEKTYELIPGKGFLEVPNLEEGGKESESITTVPTYTQIARGVPEVTSTSTRLDGTAIGYKVSSTGQVILDEEEQKAISRIMELSTQDISVRAITKMITEEGFKPRATKWHYKTVSRIIKREQDKLIESQPPTQPISQPIPPVTIVQVENETQLIPHIKALIGVDLAEFSDIISKYPLIYEIQYMQEGQKHVELFNGLNQGQFQISTQHFFYMSKKL